MLLFSLIACWSFYEMVLGPQITISANCNSRILEEIRVRYDVPALGAAKLKNGIFSSVVVGVRKYGDPTLAKRADKFHLGSTTKAMTATLFAILVERGILHWKDTLAEALPPRIVGKINQHHRNTTLEALTLHTSGIFQIDDHDPPFIDPLFWDLYTSGLTPREGRAFWTEYVLSKPPVRTPGMTYHYANTNYVVLGHILEEKMHSSWESLITDYLFNPVGMTDCGFGPGPESTNTSVENPWPHNFVNGTVPVPSTWIYADNPEALGPAGTVHCSLESWGKFLQMHLDGHAGRPTRLLTQASYLKLHTVGIQPDNYTYGGWFGLNQSWAGTKGPQVQHEGSNTLNDAFAWLDLEGNKALLAVSNIYGPGGQNGTAAAIFAMAKGELC